jgi:hypothetical protein
MDEHYATNNSAVIDPESTPGASRSQLLAAGGIAVILFVALWGAWVLLIGARPCALSYLWWR